MSGVRYHVIFVDRRQVSVDDVGAVGRHAVPAELGRPQLDRNVDGCETIGAEGQGERICDNGGLDPRVVRQRLRRIFLSQNLLAGVVRRLPAKCGDAVPIRIGADDHEPGVATPREPKQADPFAVDVGGQCRRGDHVIDQALDVGGPFDIDRKIVGLAQIRGVVAGMVDRGHDETGVGEGFGGIEMADENALPAMRDDDERQFLTAQRAIFHARQGEPPRFRPGPAAPGRDTTSRP